MVNSKERDEAAAQIENISNKANIMVEQMKEIHAHLSSEFMQMFGVCLCLEENSKKLFFSN